MRTSFGRSLFATTALAASLCQLSAAQSSLATNDNYQLALANLSHGNCAQAISILDPLSAQLGQDPDFWLTYAKAHECIRDYDGALQGYRIVAAAHPANTVLSKKIGEMLYLRDQQKAEQARQKLQQEKDEIAAQCNNACAARYPCETINTNDCYSGDRQQDQQCFNRVISAQQQCYPERDGCFNRCPSGR